MREEMSEMSGVSRVCISHYESSKYDPSFRNISKLSNALKSRWMN
ncbi:MAG: helix-turn-helix transcriptional regulator [Clostridia bacterium]|nr:helix-turn-helix transcriptional regulator [Clostridia bacterium]